MRYALVKKILLPFFRNNFKEVNGLENLPEKKSYVLAVNHIDYLDGPFISFAFEINKRIDVYFLSKTKNYWWSAATLPIDPKNKTKSVEQAANYLKEGKIICNFIEGQRNPEKQLLEGKTGAVRSALIAGAPIVPVGIISRFHKTYSGSVLNLLRGKHKVIINIGPPLTFEKYYGQEMTKEFFVSLTHKVMREIAPLCGKNYFF